MRRLELVAPQQLEWREVPEPTIDSPTAAIVEPIAAANCDIDRYLVAGLLPITLPIPIGHECTARVIAVGESVQTVRPGDDVVVPCQISCGACQRCRAGLTGSCLTAGAGATYGLGELGRGTGWGGTLSDRLLVPYADAMLVRVPPGIDPREIPSLADNVPDAFRTVAPGLRAHPGEAVLICGGSARSIGLYAILVAQALGAPEVIYIDTDQSQLSVAEALGARTTEGFPRKAGSFAVTVDASGDPEGLACAARSTAPGGVCTSCARYSGGATMPLLEMFTVGLTFVTGRPNVRADLPGVLRLIGDGHLAVERITSRRAAWEDAPEAYSDLPVKVVLSRS